MERILLFASIGIAVAAWLLAASRVSAKGAEPALGSIRRSRVLLLAAIGLPLLVFAATLPSSAPFSPGQGWGRGFLVGGLALALAAWPFLRAAESGRLPEAGSAAIAGLCGMAVAAIALPLVAMRPVVLDGLAGVAIGWFCGSVLLLAAEWLRFGVDSEPDDRGGSSLWTPISAGALFTSGVYALVSIGVLRGAGGTLGEGYWVPWAVLALGLAALVPALVALTSLPGRLLGRVALRIPLARPLGAVCMRLLASGEERSAAAGVQVLVSAGVLALGAWYLGSRFVVDPGILTITTVGLVAALLVWALVRDQEVRSTRGEQCTYHLPLAALVMLCAGMVGWQKLAGYGVGIAMLAAWLPLALGLGMLAGSQTGTDANGGSGKLRIPVVSLIGLSGLGVILVLFRLCVSRYSDEAAGGVLPDFYGLIALLTGASTPWLLGGWVLRQGADLPKDVALLFRLVAAGAGTLVVPALVLVVLGPKAVFAFIAGLALSVLNSRGVHSARHNPNALLSVFAPLLAVGSALAMTQWAGCVLKVSTLTRTEKTHVVLWVAGCALALLVITEVFGWLAQRVAARREGLREAEK